MNPNQADFSPLSKRFFVHPSDDRLSSPVVGQGTMADYRRLSEYHYKAHPPATATRVLVLQYPQEDWRDRFGRLWDIPSETENGRSGFLAGVLVESLPSLSCAMREHALGQRYTHLPDTTSRATLLNREVRCISRVVIHPCLRGRGLAVRLVKAAIDSPTTRFTEALAAMGRVNPFFAKAGMQAYPRPSHEYDLRLIAAMQRIGLSAIDLAMLNHCRTHLDRQDESTQRWFRSELLRWHARNGGRSAARRSIHREDSAWKSAQERLLAEPVYYLTAAKTGPVAPPK